MKPETEHLKYFALGLLLVTTHIFIFGKYGPTVRFAAYGLLCTILLAACLTDMVNHTIPDRIIILGLLTGTAAAAANPSAGIPGAVLGSVFGAGLPALLSRLTRGGIGAGDVKLFACVGIFLGPDQTLSALLASTVLSGIAGLILAVARCRSMRDSIPFTPFIYIGCTAVILLA
ncbi:MAG: A24 family peptidase [Clostridiales bacterium]|jgi:leader peptidase (prepilin peptidase)/N-methyltransferase|nr:A24 family peptidase [Eubacteriales bacterium]MDH7565812.1 A24 family peptidase [Clostridiales bacterium]